MKTEALRAIANDLKYNTGLIHSNIQLLIEESFISGVKYGQSNLNIKQLEWVEVNSLGEMGENGIKAKTSFGDYEVYVKSDHDGYVLWCLEKNLHIFDTEMQAKMYAQADFEKRVTECLDYD